MDRFNSACVADLLPTCIVAIAVNSKAVISYGCFAGCSIERIYVPSSVGVKVALKWSA
jgi:hypothetical protein